MTQSLIRDMFASRFDNIFLRSMDDAASLPLKPGQYAMTTDSFVVDPIFFPGGDIGKLSVCGTVNDLASCAAEPAYFSVSFIIEEGLALNTLEKVVVSMAREADSVNVKIVTGDTKVVPHGKADKIFINTTGVGRILKPLNFNKIRAGDKIIINGPIAQHGLSVLAARQKFVTGTPLKSDCKSLWSIVKLLLQNKVDLHFMRDPTRGGVSAAANEIAQGCGLSLVFFEKNIPLTAPCRSLSEILGIDVLEIANEGKMLFFVAPASAAKALKLLRAFPGCSQASIIGEVIAEKKPKVYLRTVSGGSRVVGMPVAEAVPRIC